MRRIVEESAVVMAKSVAKATGTPSEDAVGSQLLDGPAAKRVALAHATALAGLTLQVVIQFAGSDEGIFIASVCRSWRTSYKSTFKNEICTRRAAGVMSLQRIHSVWSEWSNDLSLIEIERNASWYIGKYSPRAVLEVALLDESLVISSEYLMRGIGASGRATLMNELWKAHIHGLDDVVCQLGVETAEFGHLPAFALAWSRVHKDRMSDCGELSAAAAARGGYVNVLEFLSLTNWWNESSRGANLLNFAAAYDKVEVLRWLTAHGHEYDSSVARSAGVYGACSTMDFLLENGCPGMNKDFVSCCVQHGKLHGLQWCYDTLRIRMPEVWNQNNLQQWLLLAGLSDKKHAASFLIEHGVWPDIGDRFGRLVGCHDDVGDCTFVRGVSICIWSVSFLEWAMTAGCTFGTWTTKSCAWLMKSTKWDSRADPDGLKVFAWLHSHGCPCACPRDVPDF